MLLRVLLLVTVCLALAELSVERIEHRLRAGWNPRPPTRLARRANGRARHHRGGHGASQAVAHDDPPRPDEPDQSPRELPVADLEPVEVSSEVPGAAPPSVRRPSPKPKPERAPEGGKPVPDVPTLTGQELENLFLGADDWLERATFKRAKMPDGTVVGIYVTYQGDTPLAGLGVQPGDILTTLNGHPLLNEDDYRWAGDELREGTDFAVGVQRDGAPAVLQFRVAR